jgi:hypothetical protein
MRRDDTMAYDLEISGSVTVHKNFNYIEDLIEYLEFVTIDGTCSLTKDGFEIDHDTQQGILEAAHMARELGVWVFYSGDDVEL